MTRAGAGGTGTPALRGTEYFVLAPQSYLRKYASGLLACWEWERDQVDL